ncbi:MAG: hypothetical protein IPK60_24570 [Sandaracinaceae bacterium]|nr:hypothetical protein [Sandaracinaceae bacterium]
MSLKLRAVVIGWIVMAAVGCGTRGTSDSPYLRSDGGAPSDGGGRRDANFVSPPPGDTSDTDHDGLSDADEINVYFTDPTQRDSDGDGITDLGEVAAGADPNDASSRISDSDFFVVLPYNGEHQIKSLHFGTNIQVADVFFLIDDTGSMQSAIDHVNSSMRDIASQVHALIPDVQFGVGSYEDFPIGSYGMRDSVLTFRSRDDWPFHLDQMITDDLDAVNDALALTAEGGSDTPESSIEALYQTATGAGVGYEGGSVPPATCPYAPDDFAPRVGYPCFRPGALPIVVLVTDAPFHNGPGGTNAYDRSSVPNAHSFDDAALALNSIGARFIGVDLDAALEDESAMAIATGSVDPAGYPLVYMGTATSTAERIVTGITSLVGRTPQDVGAVARNVAGNPDDFDARVFIKSIAPVEGYNGSASGPMPGITYASHDDTTFYQVIPGTSVEFSIDFWNDARPPGVTAQVFKANIVVVGNSVATLDVRTAYIIVPSEGGIVLL